MRIATLFLIVSALFATRAHAQGDIQVTGASGSAQMLGGAPSGQLSTNLGGYSLFAFNNFGSFRRSFLPQHRSPVPQR